MFTKSISNALSCLTRLDITAHLLLEYIDIKLLLNLHFVLGIV